MGNLQYGCQFCFTVLLQDLWGVTMGALGGHAICTGIAVLGGRFVAQLISVRTGMLHLRKILIRIFNQSNAGLFHSPYTVTIISGVVFIFFALFALMMGED